MICSGCELVLFEDAQCTCAGEIIDRLRELQSLKVDVTKDKDKQKSDAKSIVHRRRKALTDLFKALELIGIFCFTAALFLVVIKTSFAV